LEKLTEDSVAKSLREIEEVTQTDDKDEIASSRPFTAAD